MKGHCSKGHHPLSHFAHSCSYAQVVMVPINCQITMSSQHTTIFRNNPNLTHGLRSTLCLQHCQERAEWGGLSRVPSVLVSGSTWQHTQLVSQLSPWQMASPWQGTHFTYQGSHRRPWHWAHQWRRGLLKCFARSADVNSGGSGVWGLLRVCAAV
jgi:hypothetical protein